MTQKTAVIFGGTGFVGRHIVKDMADKGWLVKVASRVPERGYFLKPLGDIGQIVPVQCDVSNYDQVSSLVEGADFVVNCIGILFEKKKKQSFQKLHADFPESLASACSVAKVKRFVHISALGVDIARSNYAKSKWDGEKRILKSFPGATILRPSIVFGEDDAFFNKFASMAKILPFLPLIGGGETKFQPIFVGDVAEAVMAALTLPKTGDQSPLGQIYELGGPDVLTFEELFKKMFDYTGQSRFLLPLPYPVAKIKAKVLSLLPEPLLTEDQVESLKTHNMVSDHAKTLEDLNVVPTSLDAILPDYLTSYRKGGRFAA